MTPETLALIQLIAKVGLDAALVILQAINKPAATIDDAIAALEAARAKTSADYLAEAKAALPAAG
jgi:hypothetical protein